MKSSQSNSAEKFPSVKQRNPLATKKKDFARLAYMSEIFMKGCAAFEQSFS